MAMVTQEVWVHGTSGNIEARKEWGWSKPMGWGLYLEGNVEEDAFEEDTWEYLTWVHFHIPLPSLRPEEQDAPRLQKVMLQLATDKNESGWFPHSGSESMTVMWQKNRGGAMIRTLHIYDGDMLIQAFDDLDWQSRDWETSNLVSRELQPDRPIHSGLGISVNVRFINQKITDMMKVQEGRQYPVDGWNGKPFQYDDVATSTKRAVFSSVGCRYAARMPVVPPAPAAPPPPEPQTAGPEPRLKEPHPSGTRPIRRARHEINP